MVTQTLENLSLEALIDELAKREASQARDNAKEANTFLELYLKFGMIKTNKAGRKFVHVDAKKVSGHTVEGLKVGTSPYGTYIELV